MNSTSDNVILDFVYNNPEYELTFSKDIHSLGLRIKMCKGHLRYNRVITFQEIDLMLNELGTFLDYTLEKDKHKLEQHLELEQQLF